MNAFDEKRRSFLFSVGVLGMNQILPQSVIGSETAARQGYVLGAAEGENLFIFVTTARYR